MSFPDEPNLVIPMASTVNERGVAGYTHSVTNSEDQRKLNCIYELSKNTLTGKGRLTLAKRPGVSDSSGGATWGTSTQTVHLIIGTPAGALGLTIGKQAGNVPPWVININAGSIRASDAITDQVIVGTGNYSPAYIDKTLIGGNEVVVLQLVYTVTLLTTAQRVFFSSSIGTWTEIVDADFTGLIHRGKMEHMDGFAFILEASNRIFNSDINSLANWTATSFLTKQIVQDVAVGLAKLNNKILAFGDDTVELFYNAGNATGSPLLPIRHLHQRIGLILPITTASDGTGHYYCVINDIMYFVGRGSGGIASASLYAFDGSTFSKVSSLYIDAILSEVVRSSFYSVNAMGFHGKSAVAILLTSPNATSQRWLMFFPEWKEWFEWTSTVFSPINSGEHFLPCGAGLKAKIYNFTSTDNWQDNGTSYQWFSQFKLPTKGSPRNVLNMYGVDADTARSANDLTVEISTDDCQSFSTLGTIDLTQDRKVLFRGGAFRNAHIRLGNTNAAATRIHNFVARVNG